MDENEKTRAELMKAIGDLTDDQLNEHPEEGRWSIIQVAEHLLLMEMAVAKGIVSSLKGPGSKPSGAKPIHLAADRSVKVAAPAYLVPSDEYLKLEDVRERLARSRESLAKALSGADEAELAAKSFLHPVFGSLSLNQWAEFVGYHERRHIQQIKELKGKLL